MLTRAYRAPFVVPKARLTEVTMASDRKTTGWNLQAGLRVTARRGGGRHRRRRRALRRAASGGAGCRPPHSRRQRPRRHRQHRHPRPGQRAQARLRHARERRDQDALRHRREPRAASASTTTRWPMSPTFKPGFVQDLRRVLDDKDIDARRHRDAQPLARAGHDLGRCRPASTSTSRSRRRHTVWEGRQDGRGGARATTRSCRSGR